MAREPGGPEPTGRRAKHVGTGCACIVLPKVHFCPSGASHIDTMFRGSALLWPQPPKHLAPPPPTDRQPAAPSEPWPTARAAQAQCRLDIHLPGESEVLHGHAHDSFIAARHVPASETSTVASSAVRTAAVQAGIAVASNSAVVSVCKAAGGSPGAPCGPRMASPTTQRRENTVGRMTCKLPSYAVGLPRSPRQA